MMTKRGLKLTFKKDGGTDLEINGLSEEEIAYAVGMIAMSIEENTGLPQSEWLKMVSDTNEKMREK